jgi:hypothetical protein
MSRARPREKVVAITIIPRLVLCHLGGLMPLNPHAKLVLRRHQRLYFLLRGILDHA